MTATTGAPGFIEYYTLSDVDPIPDGFASLATSVNASLDTLVARTRQIQTFRWANQAAQGAQTGMQSGDEGWRTDTRTSYRYSGTAWNTVQYDSGWITPTLVTGWSTDGLQPVQYRKVGNEVFMRGRANGVAAADPLFTLPAGFRPDTADEMRFAGISGGAATGVTRIVVRSDGTINVQPNGMPNFVQVRYWAA